MNTAKSIRKLALICASLLVMAATGLPATVEPASDAGVGPSVVEVKRTNDGGFVYTVNDQPQFMVGMGYNPIYRHLSPAERAARYDADFSKMTAAGINTILGWDADKGYEQDKFDQLTLDRASEHGLGVVMPFYLPPDGDYTDPAFREQLKEELVAKVEAYKNHPALRMWGIGNEVIEGIIASGQVEVFDQFYLELADTAHQLDPSHPVIYREAEDVYLPYLTWYSPPDGVERPWLLYGMNFYTFRLEQVLTEWTSRGNNMPLFITEFAPENWSHPDRPAGYLRLWKMIRAHPGFVLGAAVYAWTTEGPEPVDRVYGVVDGEGNPVDGSLEALAPEFRLVNPGVRIQLYGQRQ